jgi:hypothetical protein
MLLLNSKDLADLDLVISRKSQKQKNCFNFFMNPTIDIQLFNNKVFYSDNKTIVFIYSKIDNMNLYLFCKYLSENLLYKTKILAKKIMYGSTFDEKKIFPFYFERDNKEEFTIKCNVNNNIKFYENNKLSHFSIPRKGAVYDKIILNFKNIWEDTTRVGFNMDIKEMHLVL